MTTWRYPLRKGTCIDRGRLWTVNVTQLWSQRTTTERRCGTAILRLLIAGRLSARLSSYTWHREMFVGCQLARLRQLLVDGMHLAALRCQHVSDGCKTCTLLGALPRERTSECDTVGALSGGLWGCRGPAACVLRRETFRIIRFFEVAALEKAHRNG